MKLMMVLSRFPQPIDKGDKLRAYHQLKYLSKANDIYLFCVSDQDIKDSDKLHILAFCKEVHVYKVGIIRQLINMLSYAFSGMPFQAGYFYSPVIHKHIQQAAERVKPDNILFQLIRTARYAEGISIAHRTLDYMDAFSKGYERMAGISKGLLKLLYKSEAERLAQFENEVYKNFDKHMIISEQDRSLLNHPMKDKIEIVTNGVDTDYFRPGTKETKYELLFHGNMNYMPNINCAVFIAEEILPELARRKREISLLISGASPHKRVVSLKRYKNVTITGWLDDVRTSYNQSHVFIAPVQIGTGIQNKILEAMAMGVPCVVSGLVANALNLKHNEHVLIGNSTVEYCDLVEQLIDDRQLYERISGNALTLVRTHFKWEDTVTKMQQYLSTIN